MPSDDDKARKNEKKNGILKLHQHQQNLLHTENGEKKKRGKKRLRIIIIERNAAYKDNDIKSDHFHFVFVALCTY